MRCLLIFIMLHLAMPAFASVTAKNGMVVSEHHLATQAGVDVLAQGGNAIDAAVAVGYALAVVNTCCGNIGGGGFMTIHLANGQNIALNFREKAPLKASSTMYLDKNGQLKANASTNGYLAVAVPGTVLGFETALKRYGTMTRKQVMRPAIRLAKNGYAIGAYEANQLIDYASDFRQQPNIAAIFLNHGQPLKTGDRLVQTNLANTLTLIAEEGANAFYRGPIAQQIIKASDAHGGVLSLADFEQYTVETLTPVTCDYRGYTLISSPPPSSGGTTLCDMLTTLAKSTSMQTEKQPADKIDAILKAMASGFIKRNQDTKRSPLDTRMHELTDTTHYSIIDKYGNAVAVTYTLNGLFGAGVIAGDTGFFLNNEMDDFTTLLGTANKFGLVQPQTNAIEPGKRPLSSMTPTLVMKNNRLYMIIGSPGGPRIITAVLLTLLHVIDDHMTLEAAVNAPRYHFQVIPDTVDIEPNTFTPSLLNTLRQRGYRFKESGTWSAVEAIMIDPRNGTQIGVNDYRRPDGLAAGIK